MFLHFPDIAEHSSVFFWFCISCLWQNQSPVWWNRAHSIGQSKATLLHWSRWPHVPLHIEFSADFKAAHSWWLQSECLVLPSVITSLLSVANYIGTKPQRKNQDCQRMRFIHCHVSRDAANRYYPNNCFRHLTWQCPGSFVVIQWTNFNSIFKKSCLWMHAHYLTKSYIDWKCYHSLFNFMV